MERELSFYGLTSLALLLGASLICGPSLHWAWIFRGKFCFEAWGSRSLSHCLPVSGLVALWFAVVQ